MKKFLIALAVIYPLSAFAVGEEVSPEDMSRMEAEHQQTLQAEIDRMQAERDALFVKQLEEEMLLEDARIAAENENFNNSNLQ